MDSRFRGNDGKAVRNFGAWYNRLLPLCWRRSDCRSAGAFRQTANRRGSVLVLGIVAFAILVLIVKW